MKTFHKDIKGIPSLLGELDEVRVLLNHTMEARKHSPTNATLDAVCYRLELLGFLLITIGEAVTSQIYFADGR